VTDIEHHVYINWHFQCSMIPLNLCKEYLNLATFKILFLQYCRTVDTFKRHFTCYYYYYCNYSR